MKWNLIVPVPQHLKERRKAANLTQPELADAAGTCLRVINQIETGHKKTIRKKIADEIELVLSGQTSVTKMKLEQTNFITERDLIALLAITRKAGGKLSFKTLFEIVITRHASNITK